MFTFEKFAETLKSLGYTGAVNDAMYAFLRASGYVGALPDMFYSYLRAQGYVGALSDMYSAWSEAVLGQVVVMRSSNGYLIESSDNKIIGAA